MSRQVTKKNLTNIIRIYASKSTEYLLYEEERRRGYANSHTARQASSIRYFGELTLEKMMIRTSAVITEEKTFTELKSARNLMTLAKS